MFSTIPLGPFDLHGEIDRGAMGQVWHGTHRATRLPVAVKCILVEQARERRFRVAFNSEVRQLARLDHPGVVSVYDFGEISRETAEASSGQLTAGSPYLTMEYVSGGSLARYGGRPLPWRDLRRVLQALLDSLAHAHARGVLHRDIKPANLLVATSADPRPGLKLSDFGLAHALQEEEGQLARGGTPQYMSPEQIAGDLQRQGPWSDLYAVGCVAWELAAGMPPFAGPVLDVLAMHCTAPVPALPSRAEAPPGLIEWIRVLMEKDPHDRFRCAADAAFALRSWTEDDDLDLRDSWLDFEPRAGLATLPAHGSITFDDLPASTRANVRPPMPPDWRREEAPDARLTGAGLALFALRSAPCVGRKAERDEVWAALARVRETGSGAVLALVGEPGIGKSHLATWISERAVEVGVATSLRATHSAVPAAEDGVPGLFARALRLSWLPGDVASRTASALAHDGEHDEEEHALVTRIVTGAPGVGIDARAAALRRFLERRARSRAVVATIDDAQWGPDTLAVIDRMGLEGLPVLFLVCSRAALPLPTLAVAPLDEREQAELVERILPLEPRLAAEVRRESRGIPMYVPRLVAHWVRRGVLESGPAGFALRAGERPMFPDDLFAVWRAPTERVLRHHSSDALFAGAALGQRVDAAEWAAACAALGADLASGPVDALVVAGLAEHRREGWAFIHEFARGTCERLAQESGRWVQVNAACAQVVPPGARQGRHLLLADRARDAVDPLLDGASVAHAAGRQREAADLLDLADLAVARANAAPEAPERGRCLLVRLRTLVAAGDASEADRLAIRLITAARRHGWTEALAAALRYRGDIALRAGDAAAAEGLYLQAMQSADRREKAHVELMLGVLARQRGERDRALARLRAALDRYRELDDAEGEADARVEIFGTSWALSSGFLDDTEEIESAIRGYADAHNPLAQGRAENTLGEFLRHTGRTIEAEAMYRRAAEHLDRIGSNYRIFPLLNLVILFLASGRDPDASVGVLACRAALRQRPRENLSPYLCLMEAALAAASTDWATFDGLLAQTEAAVEARGLVDRDLVTLAREVARRCRTNGDLTRGARAEELARTQERGLS